MRIIGGKYGGRRLAPVRGDVRPSSDRLRETLFNILRERVSGSTWLDGFAGSGAVGIEALSRGAAQVIFNEKSPQALRLLQKNLEICDVAGGYEIHRKDTLTLLRSWSGPQADIIFLDPPYAFPRYDKLLRRLLDSKMVREGTLVILELFKKTEVEVLPGLTVWRRLVEGDTQLLFLEVSSRNAAAPASQSDRT